MWLIVHLLSVDVFEVTYVYNKELISLGFFSEFSGLQPKFRKLKCAKLCEIQRRKGTL